MTTTAPDSLPAPQRDLRGAGCDSKMRVLEAIAGLFGQAGLRSRLRARRDNASLRATMLSARAQDDAA